MKYLKVVFYFCLCVVLLSVLCRADTLAEGRGQILYEAWPGLGPAKFIDGSGWVDLPGDVRILTEFNHWQRPDKVFTQKMSALVTIPEDGHYTFYLTSKADSFLFMSHDGSPDKIKRMIYLNQDTNRFRDNQGSWFKAHRQESETIKLKKGATVFISAIHFFYPKDGDIPKEGDAPNHLTVGWSRNGSPVEVIKGGDCRIPWGIWGAFEAGKPRIYGSGERFIEIEWPRLNLGLGITSFNVYRDGELLAVDVKGHRFLDKTAIAGTAYKYSVEAVDLLGRVSPRSPECVAMANPTVVSANGTGLTAGYYLPTFERDKDLGGGSHVASYVDTTCFLMNRKGVPYFLKGAIPSFAWYRENVIDVPQFTRRPVRMEGFLEVPYDGRWTFTLRATDRIQVWIDRRLLFDWQYSSDARSETLERFSIHHSSASIYLKAGEKVPFRLESDYRTAQLEWSHALLAQQPIPMHYLYPSNTLASDTFTVISSADSYTNPAHLEIRVGSQVEGVDCNFGGKPVISTRLDDYRYLVTEGDNLGVTITPDRTTEAVFSIHTSSGSRIKHADIRWKPIELGGTLLSVPALTIRQGDELLFKDAKTGTYIKTVMLSVGDDMIEVPTKSGSLAFRTPGSFAVHKKAQPEQKLNVRVIPANAFSTIPLYLGSFRHYSTPQAVSGLYMEPADDRMVEVVPVKDADNPDQLTLRAPNIGPSSILFRETSNSPVLAMLPTDAFCRWNFRFEHGRTLTPPWTLYHWVMLISHAVDGTLIRVEGVTRNRLCENGEWFQYYKIEDSPDNVFIAPVAYRGSGWGRITCEFYHGETPISSTYLGVKP